MPIKCSAGHLVGMQIGPIAVVKHAGRTYTGVLLTVHCRCGETWTNPLLEKQIDAALVGLLPAMDHADLPEILPKVAAEAIR